MLNNGNQITANTHHIDVSVKIKMAMCGVRAGPTACTLLRAPGRYRPINSALVQLQTVLAYVCCYMLHSSKKEITKLWPKSRTWPT
jgi:hypothetical protein